MENSMVTEVWITAAHEHFSMGLEATLFAGATVGGCCLFAPDRRRCNVSLVLQNCVIRWSCAA